MLIQRKWQGDESNGEWLYEVAQRFSDDFRPKGPAHEGKTIPPSLTIKVSLLRSGDALVAYYNNSTVSTLLVV